MTSNPTDTRANGPTKRLIPRKEAMYLLGIGRQKWDALRRAERLPISRIGGRAFVRSDVLDALIENPEQLNGPRDDRGDKG